MSEDLAWAAGFIDGEGSFAFCPRANRPGGGYVHLSAGQVDRAVLDKLHSILGVGKVYGPYQPRKQNHSPYHYWRVYNTDAVAAALLMLRPWLSAVKIAQAERAFERLDELQTQAPV